jgi:hypothetical protein
LSEVAAIARRYGCVLESPGTGRHWRFKKPGKPPYPVKAHNGYRSEIPWLYIQGLCRQMEIPESAFTDE